MIRALLTSTLIFTLLISCNSDGDKSSKTKNDKKITKRDLSINSSNAYNDLFFDSNVLIKFITDHNLDDTISRRMISFYNSRNYQFAWFTKNGLTEQARGFWNMHNYHTTYGKDSLLKDNTLQVRMNNYTEEEEGFSVSTSDKNIINTELKLTEHLIIYTLNTIEDGYVKRKEMERFIPSKKPMHCYWLTHCC